jgi:hypothetical protein
VGTGRGHRRRSVQSLSRPWRAISDPRSWEGTFRKMNLGGVENGIVYLLARYLDGLVYCFSLGR